MVHPSVTAVTTVHHSLGRLAATRGDEPAARAHDEGALAQCRRSGLPTLAQQTEEAVSRRVGPPAS